MNKPYGGWEAEMKATEPVARKAFTRERMTAIHRKAVEQAQSEPRRRKRRLFSITAAACIVFLVVAGLGLRYMERPREHAPAQTPAPSASPMQSEEHWVLQSDQQPLYEAYTLQPDDKWLRGLAPVDVFRWYMRAVLIGDFDTIYALFIDDDGYVKPSRDEFLRDVVRDWEGVQRGKEQSVELERNYRLEQRIDGDSALIVMTPIETKSDQNDSGLGQVLEGKRGFGLTKNQAGVWKVNWMPMQ